MPDDRLVKYPVFLENLKQVLREKRWDQTELAHQCDSTQSSVSRWGWSSVPRGQTLTKLAEIAGVSPSDLLETPLKEGRRPRPSALPSGRKLIETMAVLLDNAGLPHLADEYAAKLARLLPGLLADSEAHLDIPATGKAKRSSGHPQDRAKGDPGKRP